MTWVLRSGHCRRILTCNEVNFDRCLSNGEIGVVRDAGSTASCVCKMRQVGVENEEGMVHGVEVIIVVDRNDEMLSCAMNNKEAMRLLWRPRRDW